MASKEISRAGRFEPRWPVILQLLVLVSIATLPARIRLMPHWVAVTLTVALLLPMAGVWVSRGSLRWLRLEHWSTLAFCAFAETMVLLSLRHIIAEMLKSPAVF